MSQVEPPVDPRAVPRVAVVTDSTASLPADLAADRGIRVVPLQVVIGARVLDEGPDGATPEVVASALREFVPVSTSRPAPALFVQLYRELAAAGVEQVVSVHLSREMSGTFESAQLAAGEVDLPVHVVDTGQVGIATGFAALTALDVLEAGGSAQEAAEAARSRGRAATSLFYVDTLEYLRRGGRIGAAAAIVGSALSVKPLLEIVDGKVAPRERVRTASRALARLGELAVEAAGDQAVDVCVAHLSNADRAEELTAILSERLADGLEGREVMCGELGAVLGAHVGPGMVAVCVSPRPDA
ncbi:DegV family protein [Nocardioides sp. S-58]|uniref:DegV family protein n=1 Tax=Nocardioides renjunii TaxID=3095075 RepID=A0ABU5KBV4_9ACTN|nr:MULTISPECIES: DegV family protein [unclassified Nocardioides]MDZ5662458.1 DegV family protein [Nocardioides sp. S-58]WQQ23745.1 DegV family protein [Nocardioides sp. S-34]